MKVYTTTTKVVVDAYLLRIALEIITKLVYPFQFFNSKFFLGKYTLWAEKIMLMTASLVCKVISTTESQNRYKEKLLLSN